MRILKENKIRIFGVNIDMLENREQRKLLSENLKNYGDEFFYNFSVLEHIDPGVNKATRLIMGMSTDPEQEENLQEKLNVFIAINNNCIFFKSTEELSKLLMLLD